MWKNRLERMVLTSPVAEREGQDGEEERESPGKDSNIGPQRTHKGSWSCSVLWRWDYLPKGKGKKVFRRGDSSPAAPLVYLHQSQRAVPCSSSSSEISSGEKGPKARGAGRHNKETARRHRQNCPCTLSPNVRLPC